MRDLPVPVSRREFLRAGTAAAFVTALHGGVSADGKQASRVAPTSDAAPRILDLRLRTATPLAELKKFYGERIGFAVTAESATEIAFAAGQTRLTFAASDPAEGRPFYHFAFNIPENKIRLARAWQLERSTLITTPPPWRSITGSAACVMYRTPLRFTSMAASMLSGGCSTNGPVHATPALFTSTSSAP